MAQITHSQNLVCGSSERRNLTALANPVLCTVACGPASECEVVVGSVLTACLEELVVLVDSISAASSGA